MPDLCTACPVFRLETFSIFHTDPYPSTRMSLIAFREEKAAFATGDRRERGKPPVDFEAQASHIVIDTGLNVVHPQDRRDSLEGLCCHHLAACIGHRHLVRRR